MKKAMGKIDRRTVLQTAGLAAAGVALRTKLWAADAVTTTPIATTSSGKISGTLEDSISLQGHPLRRGHRKAPLHATVARA